MYDCLPRLQAEILFARDLRRSTIDVGADPEVDAGGGRVQFQAFFAVVHVLEVLLEEGDVYDFAGWEVGVV